MCLYFLIFLSRSLLSMLSVPLFKRNFIDISWGNIVPILLTVILQPVKLTRPPESQVSLWQSLGSNQWSEWGAGGVEAGQVGISKNLEIR